MAVPSYNSFVDILKEMYGPKTTWITEAYEAGTLSELELLLYKDELIAEDPFKDFVYKGNPFLKLIKKD